MFRKQLRSIRDMLLGTAYVPLCLGLNVAADLARLFGRVEAVK
jgi:hypothetical protein